MLIACIGIIITYQCDSRVLYVSPYDSTDIETQVQMIH